MVFGRVCTICGSGFAGPRNARYCLKCKEDRMQAIRRLGKQRLRDGTARKLGSIELCAVCGKRYKLAAAMQKYCSRECAAKGLTRYYHLRYEAKKSRAVDTAQP